MAAADAHSLGGAGGPEGVAKWIVAGGFALALHAGMIFYLTQAPAPHQFDSPDAVEIDLAPPATPAEDSPAENADEAQPQQLEEIVPDDTTPLDDTVEMTETETPPEELEEIAPEQATTVEQVDTVETPPDMQSAVAIPPEQTVVAREEQVEPKPAPKPVVERPKAKPRPEPKPEPVARREPPKARPQERPRPDAQRGDRRQEARAGAAAPSAPAGNPGASRAAASAYGKIVQARVRAQQRTSANLTGVVRLTFRLNRAGRPVSVSASGDPAAAAEAQAMVRRASFPPFPAEMTQSTALYNVNIRFTVSR